MQLTDDITGLILAGGRGARMGGVDKGLQTLGQQPMAQLVLERLRPQVASLAINANRHLDTYRQWGVEVWPDGPEPGPFAGPLAGFLSGLLNCVTPYLCTVPCDTPFFPHDLVARLARGLHEDKADLAMAMAPEGDGELRPQPVFCLMKVTLARDLKRFLQAGGRKIDAWTAGQRTALVPFMQRGDAQAFVNINTTQDLDRLQTHRRA